MWGLTLMTKDDTKADQEKSKKHAQWLMHEFFNDNVSKHSQILGSNLMEFFSIFATTIYQKTA